MDYMLVKNRSNLVFIEIYPYLQCWERAVESLKNMGFTDKDISRVGEGEVLSNVPFSVMGCRHRALIGTDLQNQYCAYLYPYGYKILGLFFEVCNDS